MDSAHLLPFCYPAAGAVGALIGSMAREKRLQLPRLVVQHEANGETVKFIDPGFLLSVSVGALLAAWIDHRPWTAVFVGCTVGYVGPAILVTLVIEPIAKRLGYTTDLVTVKAPEPATGAQL